MVRAFHFPDSIEVYEVGLHRDAGKILYQQLPSAKKLSAVMVGFGCLVALEKGQATIGGAVGVAHDQNASGPVEQDGHADLFEDEILLEVVARRGESFGASGDDDHVGTLDGLLPQELSHGRANAVIEAAEDGGVGDVRKGGRVEMEDLAHGSVLSSGLENSLTLLSGVGAQWFEAQGGHVESLFPRE